MGDFPANFGDRQRARLGLSIWARLSIVLITGAFLVLCSFGMIVVLAKTHFLAHPSVTWSTLPDRIALLIFIPAVFAAIPAALLISNAILHAVAPLRRAISASQPPGAYNQAQRALAKVIAGFSAPLLLFSLGVALFV
jgi:hypothetical protein